MEAKTIVDISFIAIIGLHRLCGASAAVPLVGARRADPRAHLPVRPGHFHHNPAGLP